MTTPTSELPARPSLESLRKQAKQLARRIAAGDADAIARARAHLPNAELPLSQRDAQLVLAREYGFPGWQDLVKEVNQRLGQGLPWAVSQARRRIHDNDVEGLRQLLAEYPALLSWQTQEDPGGLLGMATGSFGDAGDSFREERFTRRACAELLLDAGAAVAPAVCDGLIQSRARGLIDLFQRRGLLPRTLKFLAALGDLDGVRASLETNAENLALATVNEAFMYACHLQHAAVAELLLDQAIEVETKHGTGTVLPFDPAIRLPDELEGEAAVAWLVERTQPITGDMGRLIDGGPGRSAFIQYFIANKPDVHGPDPFRPWWAFVEQHILSAMHDGDLPAFVERLRRDPWLLTDPCLKFQVRLIEQTAVSFTDRTAFLKALLDLNPAVLRSPVPPPTMAFVHTFTYAQTQLLPMLQRIWPMPDDLPHAAGSGDFARVRKWFDEAGKPALGDLANHFPANDAWIRGNLQWGEPTLQQVLDTALAWAVMNNHFEIADFLLQHGADINTDWSSHEPASILHELVWHKNYQAMQFLIDRGIDMTIKDYRWNATAQGWARYAEKDEKMAQWLAEAQQKQKQKPGWLPSRP